MCLKCVWGGLSMGMHGHTSTYNVTMGKCFLGIQNAYMYACVAYWTMESFTRVIVDRSENSSKSRNTRYYRNNYYTSCVEYIYTYMHTTRGSHLSAWI